MKIFYKNILVLTFVPLIISILSCNKQNECENSYRAKLVNMTGLDGCSWMIELNNGTRLEPVNLSDFNFNINQNKKIWVVYHPTQFASICMAGEIVTIDCISER